MIGTFYAAATPGAQPFVAEGDEVYVGQTIGIIEAMKIMNEIAADRAASSRRFWSATGNLLNMAHRSCASELAGATAHDRQAAPGRSIRLPLPGGARIGPALWRSLARRRSERFESLVGRDTSTSVCETMMAV